MSLEEGIILSVTNKSSDFVTDSYGEYWDSSCEKSWVPVQNHWVPVKKQWVPGSFVRTATEIARTGYSTKNNFRLINWSLGSTRCITQIILPLWKFLCIRDIGRGNKITEIYTCIYNWLAPYTVPFPHSTHLPYPVDLTMYLTSNST